MPELAEPIERINYYLLKEFGVEEFASGQPKFRLVWSDDQLEKQWCYHTADGLELLYPEVREVKKYSYIRGRFILERLVPADDPHLVSKIAYEPAWTFEDRHGNYLPPTFDACKFHIERLLSLAAGTMEGFFKKYTDPLATPEGKLAELEKVEKELFGNETETGDALHYKEGIVSPGTETQENHDSRSKTSR